MKKIIISLLTLALLGGCSLDETPYSITSEALAADKNGAEQLVTSIYAVMWSSYMMKKTYMEWIDMDHDHASAESWVVSGAGQGDVTTHWGYNGGSDLWNAFYLMINRANIAEESLLAAPSFSGSKSIQQRYGEVLFLRAWAYYHLVRMYGPVPIRLAAITPTDVARSSVFDVYDVITKDLEKSLDYLTYPTDGFVGAWGHADRTAAEILLARVYCTMGSGKLSTQGVKMYVPIGDEATIKTFTTAAVVGYENFDATKCYTRVKELMTNVIGRKGVDFDLRPRYRNVWGKNNARNNEMVWGVVSDKLEDYCTEHLHYYYSARPFGGTQWAGMSLGVYRQFDQRDERIVDGIFHYIKFSMDETATQWYRVPDGYTGGTPPVSGAIDVPVTHSYYPMPIMNKWYLGDILTPEVKPTFDNSKSPIDVILIRYAEAYLLLAEALNELNEPREALLTLNVLRDRAKTTAYDTDLTDKDAIRSYVFGERGLELLQEFNRKFDLLRWGLYLNVMNETGNIQTINRSTKIPKNRTTKNLLYAVPTAEVRENKLFGPNNPGY